MTRDDAIERIALDLLGLETLQARKSDSLDFHELAVWDIRDALEAAYTAGFESGKGSRR
jgi:predicted metal-dependent hydrolase